MLLRQQQLQAVHMRQQLQLQQRLSGRWRDSCRWLTAGCTFVTERADGLNFRLFSTKSLLWYEITIDGSGIGTCGVSACLALFECGCTTVLH